MKNESNFFVLNYHFVRNARILTYDEGNIFNLDFISQK